MTAFYDFFRNIKLYSTDGTTLEATLEADSVTDSLNISRGNGVAFTGANASTDSFKIDVDYDLNVPVSTTTIRLSDVNSNNKDIALVAGGNMTITRDNANQLTIAALVGGISKSISAATQANPVRITTTNAHQFTEGTPVTIVDVAGMTNLNGNEYYMNIIDSTNFDLYTDDTLSTSLNGTGFPAYVSGGVATADYGGAKQVFKTIAVSGQTNIVADTISDTLTFAGGSGIDFTTDAGTDTVTAAIDATVTTLTGTQLLTNKTINASNNTLSNIANSSLTNSSITFARVGGNSTAASLGDTVSFQGTASEVTVGESSGTFTIGLPASVAITTGLTVNGITAVTETATQTLTNKTLTSPVISTISNTGTITLPTSTDTLVGKATTDTLTNKSISLTTNTVTGTLAEFSTAVSDATLVSIAGTETLTNKTLTGPVISSNATEAGKIEFPEATNNGTGKIVLYGADAVTNNQTKNIALPNAAGTVVVSASAPLSRSSTGDISLGTVPISKGGTGATTAATARTALTLNTDDDAMFASLTAGATKNANYVGTVIGGMAIGSGAATTPAGEDLSIDNGTINAKITTAGGVAQFGTKTAHPVDIYTTNAYHSRFTTGGHLNIGSTDDYGMLSIKNSNVGAQERGLWVESAPTAGTSPNNVAVFAATTANLTTPVVRIHHEAPTADQLLLQLTTTASNTVKFSVDEDGDVVANSITGSIPGMTWVMSFGHAEAIGDGATTITRYAGPGTSVSTSADIMNFPVPSNCKVTKMAVYISGTMTTGSAVVTMMKNGTDTSTTVTIPTSGTGNFSNATSTNYDAGDRIGVKIVSIAGTANLFTVTAQMELI